MQREAHIRAIALGLGLLAGVVTRRAVADEVDLATAVDLPRLRAVAIADNPEIRAAEERWRGSRARPSQEGSLPDPMVNTGYRNEGFDRLGLGAQEGAMLRFGAEQELPFPGKLSLREEIAAREADREGALYRLTMLGVVTRLRVAYNDYFLAHKSIEIVDRNRQLLQKLEGAAEARYRVGQGVQQDVLRAQVELSILLGRLTSLEQQRQSLGAALNALLNRPPLAPLGVPAAVEKLPLSYELEELERLALDHSPGLRAAGFDVARADSNLRLARRQYYPDFVLRADYFNKSALVPEWEVGAGIRVPLYFWRKQAFGVEEAAAGASGARAMQRATAQDVLARVKDFHARAESADRLVGLYGTGVVPQAERSLSSALAGYQVGDVDFITLLSSFTVLNDYQLRYYEELANFDKALAQLEEAAGVLPPGAGPP